jgi:predicted nucleic acid-binding protein
MRAFFDTNVLAYLINPSDQKYAAAAKALRGGGVISVQVLNEYCYVAQRKGGLDWSIISGACEGYSQALEVQDLTLESQSLARAYAERYGYSIYDANILASAKLAGCDTLWTEDMRHGQVIEGVRITNPIAAEI